MRRAQTSMEYLLLTAGVLLVGVIASQTVLQSSTATNKAIQTELNTHVVPKDVTPPTTDLICNGGVCYSRYNTDVKIGFSCVDNVGGVGCAKTYYDVTRNGSAYKSGSCDQAAGKCANVLTLTAPPAGNAYTYVIKFYSEDLNGNKEGEKSVTIKIGKASTTSALLSTCKIDHSPKWPKPGDLVDVNVSLASGDAVHNATVAFTTPAGTQTAPCGDITKVTTCSHPFSAPSSPSAYTVSVEVNGEDSFGNKGSCGSASFVVDGLAPNVSITAPDPCKWYRTDFTVHVSASDPNPSSLLHRWEYKVADGVPPEYTSGIKTFSPVQSTSKSFVVTVGKGKFCSVEGKKTCDVSAYFTDRAGNTGSKNEQYSIDYTAPKISVEPTRVTWQQNPITIDVNCTDNLSGCYKIFWKFVDAGQNCPPVGDPTYQEKNLCTPTGCPTSCPLQSKTQITLDCKACKKDLCIYAMDAAGNTPEKATDINADDGAYEIDKEKTQQTEIENKAVGTGEWLNGGWISFNRFGEPLCAWNGDPLNYPSCCEKPFVVFGSIGIPWTTQALYYVPDLDSDQYGWPKPDKVKRYPYVFHITITTPDNEAPIKYVAVRLGKYPYYSVSIGPMPGIPYGVEVDPDAVGDCDLICWTGADVDSGANEYLCPVNPRFEISNDAEITQYDSGKGVLIDLSKPSRKIELLCAVDVPLDSACYANAVYVGTEDLAGNTPFPAIHQEKIAIDNTVPGNVTVDAQKLPENPVCADAPAPNGDKCKNGWLREIDVSVQYSDFQQLSGAPAIGGGYLEIITTTNNISITGNVDSGIFYPKYSRTMLVKDVSNWKKAVEISKDVGNGELGPIKITPTTTVGETNILIVPYTATGAQRGKITEIYGYCYDENAPQVVSAIYNRGEICSSTNGGSTPDYLTVTVHAKDDATGIKSIKIVADDNPNVVLASKKYSSCGEKDVTATFEIPATKLLQLKYSSNDKIVDSQIPIQGLKAIVCDQVGNCKSQYLWKEGAVFNRDLPDTIYILNAGKYQECWSNSGSYEQEVCGEHKEECAPTSQAGWDNLVNTYSPSKSLVEGYCSTDATIAFNKYELSCNDGDGIVNGKAYILASDGEPRCATISTDTITESIDCSAKNMSCCAGKCYDPDKETCCYASWDYERSTYYDAKIANTSKGEFCCKNDKETVINVCSSDQCCDKGTCTAAADYCGTPKPEDCNAAGCINGCEYTCKANSCTIVCT